MNADRSATTPLLTTKLHAPRRRRELVERARLAQRLSADALPALTLVSAPAGFGKTTLLADRLVEDNPDGRPTAWLSLDRGDNDPGVFWSYVIAALATAEPDVGDDARALLQASAPLESVVGSVLNDLTTRADEVVLVVDDYHVIESPDVHRSLAFLIDHLPAPVHLVLAGRADPPFPLARLRARGELLEIRATDLRFTAAEATTYCNRAMGLELTPAAVEVLTERTEGWIAALQLAALSMRGRDDVAAFIEGFAGDDRFVVDYLAEEVLERQPEPVRRFLLDTSVLDRLTGALCDAVTATTGSRATLEQLDRANLFLVPLDDRRRWYRYHHLFADVLRARLADEQPERRDDLHRRAAAWFEETGDLHAAIAHALAGHDVDAAARLIELAAPALFQSRQEATARRWLTALPDDLFPDRPVLSILLVGARMVSGETTDVEPLLRGIEHWLEPDVDQGAAIVFNDVERGRLPAQVQVYRAALALIAGDRAGTIEHASRALELALADDHLRRGSAAALVGLAQWSMGDVRTAARRYAEAIASLTAAGHITDVLGCSIALADMQTTLGHLGEAIHTYRAALALAEQHGTIRGTADMHAGLSEVLLERNELEAAREHLERSDALGEQAGLPQHPYRWRVARARLLLAEGEVAAAVTLLEEAVRRYHTDMSPPVRPAAAVLARARLAGADLEGARRWVAEQALTPEDELSYVREFEHVTLARLLVADLEAETRPDAHRGPDPARRDDVVELLDRLLAAAEGGARIGSTIEILVVLARAHQAGGDQAAATAALDLALTRAAPEGHLRVFVDELPALAPPLEALAASATSGSLAGRHARRVLEVGAPARAARPPRRALVDDLSARELDVLRLLESDLSGPEIARELVVSLNTVRTHTKNIYMKLGVNNRREAVTRARELGL